MRCPASRARTGFSAPTQRKVCLHFERSLLGHHVHGFIAMTAWTAGLTVCAVVALAGCRGGTPSEADAQAALAKEIARQTDNAVVSIAGFRKTDGQNTSEGEIKSYRFFYDATVNFPEGYFAQCLSTAGLSPMEQLRVGMMCSQRFTPFDNGPFRPEQPGATVNVRGEIRLQQTEQGWVSDSVMIQRNEQPDSP